MLFKCYAMWFFGCLMITYRAVAVPCDYGGPNVCPEGYQCVKLDKNRSECTETHGSGKRLFLPFKPGVNVFCDQGNLSADGNSHNFQNTAFALDLSSGRSGDSGVKVVSVTEGIAITYADCTQNNTNCGAGFGNHVKVFSEDGTVAMYAHLKRVFIKNGVRVNAGSTIGLEGQTGLAGEGNTHLHFSMHSDWRPLGVKYWEQLGYLPPSIPFQLSYCYEGSDSAKVCRTCLSTELICRRKSGKKSFVFRDL